VTIGSKKHTVKLDNFDAADVVKDNLALESIVSFSAENGTLKALPATASMPNISVSIPCP